MAELEQRLAGVPFQARMAAAHRLMPAIGDQDERKAMLAVLLWPDGPPPMTPERQAELGIDVWLERR